MIRIRKSKRQTVASAAAGCVTLRAHFITVRVYVILEGYDSVCTHVVPGMYVCTSCTWYVFTPGTHSGRSGCGAYLSAAGSGLWLITVHDVRSIPFLGAAGGHPYVLDGRRDTLHSVAAARFRLAGALFVVAAAAGTAVDLVWTSLGGGVTGLEIDRLIG